MEPNLNQPQPNPFQPIPPKPSGAKWIILGVIIILILGGGAFAYTKYMPDQKDNQQQDDWIEYTPTSDEEITKKDQIHAFHDRLHAFLSEDPEQFESFFKEMVLADPKTSQEEKDKALGERMKMTVEEAEEQAKLWSFGLVSKEKLATLSEDYFLSEKEKLTFYKKGDLRGVIVYLENDDSIVANRVWINFIKNNEGKLVILSLETN